MNKTIQWQDHSDIKQRVCIWQRKNWKSMQGFKCAKFFLFWYLWSFGKVEKKKREFHSFQHIQNSDFIVFNFLKSKICNKQLRLIHFEDIYIPMNFSNASSVGANTVKGPGVCRTLVKSAVPIKAANVLNPSILSCSGMFLGVIKGNLVTVGGLTVFSIAGEWDWGQENGLCETESGIEKTWLVYCLPF